MDEFPFSALFLFAQSCLTDAVNVIFSDYCFTDTYLRNRFCIGWISIMIILCISPQLCVGVTSDYRI